MRTLLVLGMLIIVNGAMADPNVLSGACLIAHYCEALGYSSDPPALGWCGEYLANHAITYHNQQVNRIDTATTQPASWFIIAAWDFEDKIWCSVEFGLGEYNPDLFSFTEQNPCFPATGGLENPTPGWPGPGEGIALMVSDESWEGNYLPIMHFGGYAYGYYGETVIPIDVNPATGFAGFWNCASPPEPWDNVNFGGLGINTDGIYAQPDWSPWRVCCLPWGDCMILAYSECESLDGEPLPTYYTSCDPDPCIGACCLPEPPGSCEEWYEAWCLESGGEWQGHYTTCEPVNPCVSGTSPRDSSLEVALWASQAGPLGGQIDLTFDLPRAAPVSLRIFDASGRMVANLLDTRLPAGRHECTWDTAQSSAGVYLLRLVAGEYEATRTVVVVD